MTQVIQEILTAPHIDKANIKSSHIIAKLRTGLYDRDSLKIEIIETNQIEDGVSLYIRAWKNGDPVGFGEDGTIEIERVRIFNPPVLVFDDSGDIEQVLRDEEGNEVEIKKMKEDAVEAILQSLEQIIGIVGKGSENIIVGKKGKTTSTFYADAGGDGYIARFSAFTWSGARDGSSGSSNLDTEGAFGLFVSTFSAGSYSLTRHYFPFDTSPISSGDVISSATFSVYSGSTSLLNNDSTSVVPVRSNQSSLASLDFPDWVPASYTQLSTPIALSNWSSDGYKNYALNTVNYIAKGSGFTKLMLTTTLDTANSAPTGSNRGRVYFSDQGGTSQDPKLVVVHAAPVPEINVKDSESADIVDGETTPQDFGTITVGGASPTLAFTVQNTGSGTLNISDVTVPNGYTITESLSSTIAAAGSDTFTVSLNNDTAGIFAGNIEITSDDSDEAVYSFAVTGEVTAPANQNSHHCFFRLISWLSPPSPKRLKVK